MSKCWQSLIFRNPLHPHSSLPGPPPSCWIHLSSTVPLNMDGGHHLLCFMWIYWYTCRENLCAMSCVSTVTSRAVVSQSRHLSIEICPPFDLAAAVHGNLVDVDVHHFYILPPSCCTDSFLRCILMQHGHLMQRQVTNMWGGEPICWSISDKKDPTPDGNLRLVSPKWWLSEDDPFKIIVVQISSWVLDLFMCL